MSTHSEDAAQQAMDRASSTGKKAGRKAANFGKKAAGKVGKKALKVVGHAVVQGIGWVLAALSPVLVPLLIATTVLLSLTTIVTMVEFDSRPKTQNQQDTVEGSNEFDTKTETVEKVTDDNLVVKAFYINYANQSYYQKIKGEDEIYHVSEGKTYNGELIVDKYKNEEKFKLSPNLLWALDEYVFGKKIRFPEAFIRPVYVDENMDVQPLANEEDVLVESQKYDENGNIIPGETTVGVWDYGIAPIITYEAFEEKSHYLYETKLKDVWSEEKQQVIQVPVESDDSVYDTKKVNVDGFPRKVFLIDSVSTFMGTARNKIVSEEKNTGELAPQISKVKYGEKKVEREVCKTRYTYRLILTLADGTVKKYNAYQVKLVTSPNQKDVVQVRDKKTNMIIDQIKGSFTQQKKMVPEQICETVVDVYELYKYYEGYRYEEIPRYEGETEYSELLGEEYLKQYLETFETYVPEDVIEDFDLKRRIKENPEKLEQIVEMYEISKQSLNESTSLEIPATDQGKLATAAKYDHLFIKYAEMYGIDPYVLRAMAAQETGGQHDIYIGADRCAVKGCGIMQIEKPGIEVTQATAWRFKDDDGNDVTPYRETIKICPYGTSSSNCADVSDIEQNIQIGAMQLAQRFSVFDYNVMVSIQAYNFGEGGIKKVISLYAADYGKTVESVIASPSDLGWLNYRLVVSQNPSLLGSRYSSYKRYGDPTYLEKIMSYLPVNHIITVKTPDGSSVFVNSELEGVVRDEGGVVQSIVSNAVSGITNAGKKLGSFLDKMWDGLQETFLTLFSDRIDYLNKTPELNTEFVTSSLDPKDIDKIITMVMAFEEETYMSELNPNSDPEERAKLLFDSVFAKPQETDANLTTEVGADIGTIDPYFGGNVGSPLKGSENQNILVPHNKLIGTSYHNGVDVFAPYKANVKAIADGEIIAVGKSTDEHIGHYIKISHGKTAGGTVMVSVYGRLDADSISGFKVGDKVAKEQKIGTVAQASDSKEQSLHFELLSNDQQVDPAYLFSSLFSGDIPMTSDGFVAPVNRGRISCYLLCPGYPLSTHDGVDIARLQKDKDSGYLPQIFASNSGVIVRVQRLSNGYGNNILVKHNVNGQIYLTLYAHLSSFASGIQEGAMVTTGQFLGYMGTTGFSTGVHLHYGVYRDKYVYNTGIPPAPFLPITSTAENTYVGTEPKS